MKVKIDVGDSAVYLVGGTEGFDIATMVNSKNGPD